MKIESVDYAILPYGTGAGDHALIVTVSDEKSDNILKLAKDLPGLSEKEGLAKLAETEAKEMFDTLKSLCSQSPTLGVQLELALIAKTQFFFAGEAIVKADNAKTTMLFFDMISVESLNRQKNSVHVTKLRPPFLGLIARPTEYSGANSLYECFNYLIINCSLDGISSQNVGDYYREFAMIEISRHQFASFAFKIGNEQDIDLFKTFYQSKGVIDIDPRRVYFIPKTTDPENIKLVAKYCLETGYRFGLNAGLYCSPEVQSL